MDDTLRAVGQLLIQALPTFFIVLFLYAFLKAVFFGPLDRILAQRREATEGARKQAAEALDRANARVAAYEEQIRAARNEIYKEQEELRRNLMQEQSARIAEARKASETALAAAKSEIAAQSAEAERSLARETQALADTITRTILHGRTA